ncbi:GPW/gp25 family protein [Candidatus Pelagibacter sp.]|nr:GPW/gp25 family protein [Candidatus Pelagibacter sp.]
MAYNIININPLDLSPSKGVGIQVPFNGPTGLNITYTTKDATKSNILNFFLTGKRERIMNPNLGAGIREQLFEQITQGTVQNMEDIITFGLSDYFPQITLNKLTINASPDQNFLQVYISYSIKNGNIKDELLINFNNG